jgi:hypothetical protein
VALAGELRASISVLDQLEVAGEEEELAPASSTSVGRVVLIAAVILLLIALAVWLSLQ